MRRLLVMLKKELRQLWRDPKLLPILFVSPVVQLLILGYAATMDIKRVELTVVDLDRTAASRDLVNAFTASTYFRLVTHLDAQPQLDRLLQASDARVALTIPEGYAAARAAGRPVTVQLIADGSDSTSGLTGLTYARGVIQDATAAGGARPQIELLPRILYNPDLVSRNYMVPGVLAMIVMVMTMMLTSMALVRELEIGTMEQLLGTPLGAGHIIMGKLVPYALVGFAEIVPALLLALLWFRVPLEGSMILLILLTVPFILCMLALGLLVSTVSSTQQQAMMISSFFFMLPQILLSGFIFPIQNMPQAFQWATYAIPLRYYLTVLRGIFLKGVGLEVLWPQALAMIAIGLITLAVARFRFRQTVA